jgi:hypothetical protein
VTTFDPSAPSETRDNVITMRVSDADLAAVDSLVEVGIMKTRSEAAARLLHAGIAANQPLLENDASLEDIMYELYFRQRVDRGLKEVDEDQTVSHDEVRRSVAEWLRSAGR